MPYRTLGDGEALTTPGGSGRMGWSPTFGPAGAEDVSLVAGGPLAPPIHLAFAATSGAFLLDPDGHNVEAVWHAPDER